MVGRSLVKRRANLRDVARLAGVSVATVSRVLNTPSLVHLKTRTRVEAVIEELGFVRNAAARAINSGRTRILGALIPTLDSDIFALTISAIEKRLVDLGFSLVVATTDDDLHTEARKAQELLDNGVEGFFLTGTSHCDPLYKIIERSRVPTVAISCFDPSFRLPTIGYDNHYAATLAYEYLVSMGHQRIAVVHGSAADNDRTSSRLEAIASLRADRLHGLYETEFSVAGGAAAARRVLQASQRYTALLCLSDVLAFGALHELHREGLAVPDDMSVMGIHDLPAAKETFPRLTTVHLPVDEMGNRAAEALARWVVENQRPDPFLINSHISKRETVAAMASG